MRPDARTVAILAPAFKVRVSKTGRAQTRQPRGAHVAKLTRSSLFSGIGGLDFYSLILNPPAISQKGTQR